jgi:hypothetical protein
MAAEVWKRIPGFSDYQASTHGNVRVLAGGDWHKLKPSPDAGGRRYIVLVDDAGKRRNVSVAKVVLLAHVGRPKKGRESVIHGKGGVASDALGNLSYGTPAELFASVRGRMQGFKGAKAAVVTKPMAERVSRLVRTGKTTVREAARKEKVPRTSLADAIKRVNKRSDRPGGRARRKSAA